MEPNCEETMARARTIADCVSLSDIMSRDVVSVPPNTDAVAVATLLARAHLGCVPVVDAERRPIGMITKTDLVEHPVATGQQAGDVMRPMSMALHERATIAHAAALMASENVHHVLVVDLAGQLTGIVSSLDIVRWLAQNDGFVSGAV